MSFYIYYGKVKDDLLVAVLPNGTVEEEDPVYIYSANKFFSYQATDVNCLDDGEDKFVFHDGTYTYNAVSQKGYRELSLNRKIVGNAEEVTVQLDRHYSQPQIAIPAADPPKVWTGTISFHDWAKKESFIVVAPKGLGADKPIVSIWQWTKDYQGTPKTLSRSTDKQQYQKGSSSKFSFKQNGYYTLDCEVDPSNNKLKVTIGGPTNEAKVQDALVLSAKVTLGAEHKISPPKPTGEKITFDCIAPGPKPSLPRITGALPFPADLVETLTYSAAYVDQAGYLAKYAVKQFDKLEKSFQQLDKKSEARGEKVIKLEGDNSKLVEANEQLKANLKAIKDQLEKERKDAAACAEKDQAELQEAKKRASVAEAEVKRLKCQIEHHGYDDKKRDEEWQAIKKQFEAELDRVNGLLRKLNAEMEKLRKDKETEINCLNAQVKLLTEQSKKAEATINDLKLQLVKEQNANRELTVKLAETEGKLEKLTEKCGDLEWQIQGLDIEIDRFKKNKAAYELRIKENADKIKAIDKVIESLRVLERENKHQIEINTKDLESKEEEIAELRKRHREEIARITGKGKPMTTPTDTPKTGVTVNATEIKV